MAVAATLQQAADIALANVQEMADTGANVRDQSDQFIGGFLGMWNDDSAAERTVLNWSVPYLLVHVTVEPIIVNQTQVMVYELGMVLFRLMTAGADASSKGRISVAQSAALLKLYNDYWS